MTGGKCCVAGVRYTLDVLGLGQGAKRAELYLAGGYAHRGRAQTCTRTPAKMIAGL
jgi:hypothetical protein